MARIVALDADTLAVAPEQWERLRAFGDLSLYGNTPHGDLEKIVARAQNADILLTNKVPLLGAAFARLPKLRCVCVLATGYNVVDIAAAKARGVAVCNVPSYGTDSVAQHALALLLELTNHAARYGASVAAGDWVRSGKFWYRLDPVRELAGKTAGIVGWGAIGQKMGAVLRALGMKLLVWTRTRKPLPEGAQYAESPDELFARADIVSLHCPLNAETEKIVNVARLAKMKPSALLINTARGGLVDERALANALKRGQIAGAAVDVVDIEPMRADCPLLNAPNCLITPHIAWASDEATGRLFEITLENIQAYLAGAPIHNVAR